MARGYVLPRLEIPEGALLLHEHMIMKDADRTGNWRFYIDTEGCFYHARNRQLWLTESEQFESDDPALTWNTPFPSTPVRCLTEAQFGELMDTIRTVAFADLAPIYTSVTFPVTSSPWVERWTLMQEGAPLTVVVEQGATPLRLTDFRATLDRLIAAAPRVTE